MEHKCFSMRKSLHRRTWDARSITEEYEDIEIKTEYVTQSVKDDLQSESRNNVSNTVNRILTVILRLFMLCSVLFGFTVNA